MKPVFENGLAMPVFEFTDGRAKGYNPETSSIARFCVYVESDYDMDRDGQRDLIKACIQVPMDAVKGEYKAATVMEARPYCAGVNSDGYEHMKEVQDNTCPYYPGKMAPVRAVVTDLPTGEPSDYRTSLEQTLMADQKDWYYEDKGSEGAFCYENLANFNCYLVRGFAVVTSAGFGALGSDGYEFVGSNYERDAFKNVVEWIHGDRIAYTDKTRTIGIKADWANGRVGMTGRSYAGTMPFEVACSGVEGLETIVPVAGISDWYNFLNQQGAQRYWPAEMLMSFLAYFCTSRYNDESLSEQDKQDMLDFHQQLSYQQLESGFDYSSFWRESDYTWQGDPMKCSALIVHGYNDENVSTKQYEMMLKTCEKAGVTVRSILHQGPHMTPTMPNKGYGIKVDGQIYDDILNKWFCHYLYDIDNDAEAMPYILSQSNIDQNKWEKEDSWTTEKELVLETSCDGTTVIDTNWDDAGIDKNNFDEKMSTASSNINQRYVTDELSEAVKVQGTVRVDFSAALESGDAENAFAPENVNNADTLSFKLGDRSFSGRMDDVKLTVMLCDVSDESFDNIKTTDPERNVVPVKVVKEGGIPCGSNLEAFNEVEFETQHDNYRVIERAYIDLCNPASGYWPESASESIELVAGEYHDYSCYLNPNRYEVAPGHKLAVVIGTEDPVNCLIHKKYRVSINDASVKAYVPVVTAAGSLTISK